MIEQYPILIATACAGVITWIAKVLVAALRGNIGWEYIISYGGMPSFHAALMVGLSTSIGMVDGIDSAGFTIAMAVTLLIILDAVGLREYVGQNSKTINMLVDKLPAKEQRLYPPNEERVGHTIPQVIVGGVLGAAIAVLVLNVL